MSDIQDKINKILNDPEALRQVQSLGAQLGLSGSAPSDPAPAPKPPESGGDMMTALTSLAPMMSRFSEDDDVSRLLGALRPFLSEEKQERLNHAQKLIGLMHIIPLLKDSGLFW